MDEKNNNLNSNKTKGELGNYAFKFPLENSFSKVEIPFAFQSGFDENSTNNKFHSYIKIQDTLMYQINQKLINYSFFRQLSH